MHIQASSTTHALAVVWYSTRATGAQTVHSHLYTQTQLKCRQLENNKSKHGRRSRVTLYSLGIGSSSEPSLNEEPWWLNFDTNSPLRPHFDGFRMPCRKGQAQPASG